MISVSEISVSLFLAVLLCLPLVPQKKDEKNQDDPDVKQQVKVEGKHLVMLNFRS